MINSFTTKTYCSFLFMLFSFICSAQLTANFSATPLNGCAPLLVKFTDLSTGNPTQWKWDLGNGTISILQNPSVSYFNPGFYTIKLVASKAGNVDSIVKTQFIEISARPIVQFIASTTTGCFPLPVQFTDQSTFGTDTLTNWQWDFGDGFSSALPNPLHVYRTAGNFNVTLRVINNKGCLNTLSKNQYIHINETPKAAFGNNVPEVCRAPVTINFQNQSTGTGILSSEWLFGDGSTSALTNPSHIYTAPGTYSVNLIVTNSTGCKDTLAKPNAFTVGNVFPAFTASDIVCAGAPLIITNTSNPLPSSATWYFGDGTSSSLISPVKTYQQPGTYQIKLVANFGSCLDSIYKTVTVNSSPTAAFLANDTNSCSYPFTVNFSNLSSNGTSFQWDFGDNTISASPDPVHIYDSYGNFDVQLITTASNGCTGTLRKTSYIKIIKPVVVINNLPDSGCVPFTKNFTSTTTSFDPVTSYLWDFGDGATSSAATPSHIYSTPGTYTVRVIISTAGGCSDTAVMLGGIVTNSRPAAIFSATPRVSCAKNPVIFKDESTGNVIKWLWDFGDGSSSVTQNPQHAFNDSGNFDIKLVVWNSGCPDTAIYKQYVQINLPIARFTESFDCNRPQERLFTNQSIGADEWNWDFGDGTTSLLENPLHTYASPGSYNVSLLVRNHATGCEYIAEKILQVILVKASFFASDTVICKGNPIIFTTGLALSEIKLFDWDFGDGTTVTSTRTNDVSHLYPASGNYTVRLIITNILGCKDTLTKQAYTRIDGPTAKFTPSVSGTCLNEQVTFNDGSVSDNNHPIQTWSWNYGDGSTEIVTAPPFQHYYRTPGAFIVSLKVTDSKGCTDSVRTPAALLISKPEALFIPLDTVSCPSKPVRFTNQSTGPGLSFLWNFGDGTTSVTKDPRHNYSADGTYTVQLLIRDQYGCTDSLTKTSVISISTPAANFTMSDSFSICPPLIVQFSNLSLHSIAQTWDFGDGTSASIFEPSHFYNYPGIYTVKLTITGKGGCIDVMQKNIVVRGPMGTFTYDPKSGCNPVKINFLARTQDRVSFVWDFNDGATVNTTDSVISHIYTNPGTYVPKMILVDVNGCQVPITGKDTIIINGITAGFRFAEQPVCDKGIVSFINSSVSNDIITSYTWNFGEGGTSAEQSPQHLYPSTGIYYPKLVVRTFTGCVDSMLSTLAVKVVSSPQITITSTPNGCTPLAVTFKGLTVVPDTSQLNWNWTFGNGAGSSQQNPLKELYTIPGSYTPTLVVTNSSGCRDTASTTIESFSIPVINAGRDTTICKRTGITLQATGAASYNWSPSTNLSCINCANPVATPDSTKYYSVKGTSLQGCSSTDTVLLKVQSPFKITFSKTDTLCKGQSLNIFARGADKYQWTPSNGLNNSNVASPVGDADTTTTYRVIGTDNLGCFKDTGYVFIKVYPIPTVRAGSDKTINVGQSIDLVPEISPDVSVVTWTPTGSIFRNSFPAISIKPSQTTEFTAEVKNGGGCIARDKVTVFVICNGVNVFIPNTFSPNGDGANDVFYPRGTGLFRVKTLRLFNRWGEVVFERNSFNANDPSFGWDGMYKGAKLGSDVFVYMIDIVCDNFSVLTYKGNVALIQ